MLSKSSLHVWLSIVEWLTSQNYTRRENFSTSPGSNWFPIAPWLGGWGVRFHSHLPSPCWNLIWLGLAHCMCCHKHNELTRAVALFCPEDAVSLGSLLPLVLIVFPSCLPQRPSKFWKSGCNNYVPYVAELSIALYPLHLGQLWVQVLIPNLLQIDACLKSVELH